VETLRLYGGRTPRFVVLYMPALYTALALFMIAMIAWLSTIWWPIWLSVSLGLGVAGGCLYLMRGWWAGALRAAKAGRRIPCLALTADEIVIHQAMLFDEPVRIQRANVAAVAVDTTGKRHWWADVRRFPVFEQPGEPGEPGGDGGDRIGWLYSYHDGSPLKTITYEGVPPNLVVLLGTAVTLPPGSGLIGIHSQMLDMGNALGGAVPPRGAPLAHAHERINAFVATTPDPRRARRMFGAWGVLRSRLTVADLRVAGVESVVTGRPHADGIEPAGREARVLARLVDFVAIMTSIPLAIRMPSFFGALGVMIAFWFCWEVPLTAWLGWSPSKRLFRLRVIRIEDGVARPGLIRATGRWLLTMLFLLIAPAAQLAQQGDIMRRLNPRLSILEGLAVRTLVVTEDERRRLTELPPRERTRALHATGRAIDELDPGISLRASLACIGAFVAIIVVAVSCAAAEDAPPTPIVTVQPFPTDLGPGPPQPPPVPLQPPTFLPPPPTFQPPPLR
jgi:hypothetical protein